MEWKLIDQKNMVGTDGVYTIKMSNSGFYRIPAWRFTIYKNGIYLAHDTQFNIAPNLKDSTTVRVHAERILKLLTQTAPATVTGRE